MEEKDKELRKTGLNNAGMSSDLEDLEEEEVAQAVEGLKVGEGGKGGAPHSIMPDPKMEAEIKEMFQDIVSQYITPIGKSIRLIAGGDLSERNLDICIGALKPLILACEEIHYNDIYDVLKSIEQPLVAFRDGKKRLLSKKDIRNITTDYKELTRLISRSVGSEMIETSPTGTMRIASVTLNPTAKKPIEELQISDALEYFDETDHKDIQKLYAGGLIKLVLLSEATAQEISESTGVQMLEAEKLKQCAIDALKDIETKSPSTSEEISIKSEISSTISKASYLEEDDDNEPTLYEKYEKHERHERPSDKATNRWLTALDAITSEARNSFQAADTLISELERTHRALVRVKVAKERLKGEIDFYQDDLVEMMQTDEFLSDEVGTSATAHRHVLKNLQNVIDTLVSAMKKTDMLYSQMSETMEYLQDTEAQLISLRRRRISKSGSIPQRSGSQNRTTNTN